MRTEGEVYVLTSEGWKPAPMMKYEPPKWYHKMLMWTVGYPLLMFLKSIEWIERRIKHE